MNDREIIDLSEVLDVLNQGIVIIDRQYKVVLWNKWMEDHSKIVKDEIVGKNLFFFFPDLQTKNFLRNSKTVFNFGNIAFLSQSIHSCLFKFKPKGSQRHSFEYMQQSVTIAPLRNKDHEVTRAIITVLDVTDSVIVENKLRTVNMTDTLTQAFNRRLLDLRVADECARFRRYDHGFSVIMFDIDNFKTVNDTYGHKFGDLVLQELVRRAQAALRDTDVLCRYGGEEFCCILPETDLKGGRPVAERIRSKIADTPFTIGEEHITVTVSLGLAQMDCGIPDAPALLDRADQALFKAKGEGKNRAVVSQPNDCPDKDES